MEWSIWRWVCQVKLHISGLEIGAGKFKYPYFLAADWISKNAISCGWASSLMNPVLDCEPCNTTEVCIPRSPPKCGLCLPPDTLNETFHPSICPSLPNDQFNPQDYTLAIFWSILTVLMMILGFVLIPLKILALFDAVLTKNSCYRTTKLWAQHFFRRLNCLSSTKLPAVTWAQIFENYTILDPVCSCCEGQEFKCLARVDRLPENVSKKPFLDLVTACHKIVDAVQDRTRQELELHTTFQQLAERLQDLTLETQRQITQRAKDRAEDRAQQTSQQEQREIESVSSGTYSGTGSLLRGSSLDMPRIRALEGRLEDVENDLVQLADNLIYAAGAFDVALQESDLRTSGHRRAIATADDNFKNLLGALKANAEGTSAAFSRQLTFLKDLMCQAEQVQSGCLNKRVKFSSDLTQRISSSVDPRLGFPDLSPLLDPNATRPQPYPPLRLGRGAFSFLPSEQLQQQTQAPRLPRSADRNQYNYYDPSTQNQGKINFNSN